ncbi:BTAD domain-containing putative transcriptional regulator [Streptomyces sp. NPDC048057]|uniref:AfsR/SARP family transcriptional regulator n=1 Tax=Streptomyces sp. NPDC048057 TaxID=3155628 RepID=UPI0033E80459
MRFGLLGTLEVREDGGGTVRIPEAKVRTLLAALLVREGRPATVDALVEDLWPQRRPAHPVRVLRAKVSQLRTALAAAGEDGRNALISVPGGYRLAVAEEEADFLLFRALAARARAAAGPAEAVAALTEALGLWRGPALAEFADAPFAAPVVTRLTEEWLTALEEQAEHRLRLGEHHALADELGPTAREHPLRERLRGAHMRALYGAGRHAEALTAFEELRKHLAEELGARPGPELDTLHRDILRHAPGLATADDAGHRAALGPRSNLPAPVNGLIGRDEEVRRVRALLAEGRLVCLTGPGGVGKTRLALEVAAALEPDCPDGVRLVELGALTRADSSLDRVAEAVAAGLGIRDRATAERGRPAPAAHLAERLRGSRLLLVLDNCEHAIAPVARLVHLLLSCAPQLRCLVTSREPLRAEGEHVHEVAPLDTDGGRPPADLASAPSAVRLFAARARAAAPHLRLDAQTLPLVASVCHRLDGLPLALELAAHRVRALGLSQLCAHLDDRFRLLDGGHRTLPRRQQTLRAVIDWSWELLTEDERRVLRRLSAHADGCAPEAVRAVAGDADLAPDAPGDIASHRSRTGDPGTGSGLGGEVLGPLSRLVEQSLVSVVETAQGPRYRLLESIAAYAAEKLAESGEAAAVHERHMSYYADFARRADPMLRGPEQRRWLHLMDQEAANLRAASATAVRRGDTDAALVLAAAPFWYRWVRGRLAEAHRLLAEALAMDGGSRQLRAVAAAWHAGLENMAPQASDKVARADAALAHFDDVRDANARARATWFLGPALIEHRHRERGRELLDQALADFRTQGDRWGTAAALTNRAWSEQSHGSSPRNAADAGQALRLFRELGDQWGQLHAMAVLGRHAEVVGDPRESSRIGREALAIARSLGLRPEESYWLSSLAWCAVVEGDFHEARELHRRAGRIATEIGYDFGERLAQLGSGLAARREGRLDAAETHLRAWLEHSGEASGTVETALVFTELGYVAELRGDTDTAFREHARGTRAALETGSLRSIARALEGLSAAWAEAGRAQLAAEHLGTAAGGRAAVRAKLPSTDARDVERAREKARAALGDETYEAAFQRGRARDPRKTARAAVARFNTTTTEIS